MTTTAPRPMVPLVADLTAAGLLPDQWRTAFLSVPREVFIPELIWIDTDDELLPLHRAEHPDQWHQHVYGPGYIITQVDDGTPTTNRGRLATSSASRLDIVALMLDAADIQPGMRVLEIGTGTGYTAALLAHQLGARNVTTIEVDPTLAAHARRALTAAGYGQVSVLTGDGASGHRAGTPYDRVIATVAAPHIPHEWITQTRPGGLVLTPWSSTYKPAGLLALTVHPQATAIGGWVNTTISFMPLRDQRSVSIRPPVAEVVRDSDHPELTRTSLHAHQVCTGDATVAIGWHVPGCHWHYQPSTSDDDRWCVWFLDAHSRSWARFDYHPDDAGRWPVYQYGPRQLWTEIEAAYQRWDHAAQPPVEQWTITITPERQHLDFTTPSQITPVS